MPLAERLTSLWESYPGIVSRVRHGGDYVAPRGMPTRELRNNVLTFTDPTRSLPMGCGRRINAAIGVAEALQLVAGVSTPDLLTRITPNMERFMYGDGVTYNYVQHGAYGPRAGWQMPLVIKKLKDDPDTRQAIITVFDPKKDSYDPVPPDVPCTLSLTFMIRAGLLELTAVMRSNDVWWGLAYDVFQFTTLQQTVARCLDVPVGSYTHVALSLHMYEKDFDAADRLRTPDSWGGTELFGIGGTPEMYWGHYEQRARDLLRGVLPCNTTSTELWMHRILRPYMKEEG